MTLSNLELRILITGFGPFPGALQPTMQLVKRLTRLRRPRSATSN